MSTVAGEPPTLGQLQDEREFLFKSLDDLEEERALGNIDDATYARLRDDYTARAAHVLRSIRDGRDERPAPVRPSRGRRILAVAAIVLIGLAAGLLLARSLGVRLPGGSPTGDRGGPATTPTANARGSERDRLEAAVRAAPRSTGAQLALARYLLSQRDYAGALEHYDTAAKLDPADPESRAYGGWILLLTAQQAPVADRPGLLDAAQSRLSAALGADATYPDTYFFLGMLQFGGRDDPAAAVPLLHHFLQLAPNSPDAPQVRSLLEQAQSDSSATTP